MTGAAGHGHWCGPPGHRGVAWLLDILATIAASPRPTLLSVQGPSVDGLTGTVPFLPAAAVAGLRGAHRGQWAGYPAVTPDFRARAGRGLLGLFTSWQGLPGDIAWRSVQPTLA
jgi:hypothetical protein